MPETTREMKKLQKLNRGDLVILLGQLEEELGKTEQENERLRSRIGDLTAKNSALEQEKNGLARRNGEIVDVLREVNKQLLEREKQERQETRPANWQAIENFARQLSEASHQAKEHVTALKQLEQMRREEVEAAKETARREAVGIVEAARQEAVVIMQRVKAKNMEMLSNIQEAVNKAQQGYDNAEKAKPAPAPPQEAAPEGSEGTRPAFSTDQVKKLLKVLKRLDKDEAEEVQ